MKKNIIKLFTNSKDENLAFHVTNDKNQVIKARKELCIKHKINYDNLKYMNQVHGNKVLTVSQDENLYECDALITNKRNTPLMVMVADCIPILFYDENNNTIAVAHAGRNGTYLNISSNVISKMTNEFSSLPSNIKVILGPSIQKCCYEVSEELANIAKVNFGEEVVNKRHIDLQKINYKQLINSGILKENISVSTICTKCSNEDYFSYRKDNSCGRFTGIISIK